MCIIVSVVLIDRKKTTTNNCTSSLILTVNLNKETLLGLTLPALQTKTIYFANSIGPDITAHNVSSGSTLFAILFWFLTETPILNNGSDQIQKLGNEMVKI